MPVASKVGNLPSKFGHARPFGCRIICYVRDRWTDRQSDRETDRLKQRLLPLPHGRRHNNNLFVITTISSCLCHTIFIKCIHSLFNSHLVCDPTIQQPGFDLPRQQWSLLNRFRTEKGHCGA